MRDDYGSRTRVPSPTAVAQANSGNRAATRAALQALAAAARVVIVLGTCGCVKRLVTIVVSKVEGHTFWGLAICSAEDAFDSERGRPRALRRMLDAYRADDHLVHSKAIALDGRLLVGSLCGGHFDPLAIADNAVSALARSLEKQTDGVLAEKPIIPGPDCCSGCGRPMPKEPRA